MVSVYKTDIEGPGAAAFLLSQLQQSFPGRRINIDLHDCDRVLRIEGEAVSQPELEFIAHALGFRCTELS